MSCGRRHDRSKGGRARTDLLEQTEAFDEVRPDLLGIGVLVLLRPELFDVVAVGSL